MHITEKKKHFKELKELVVLMKTVHRWLKHIQIKQRLS